MINLFILQYGFIADKINIGNGLGRAFLLMLSILGMDIIILVGFIVGIFML